MNPFAYAVLLSRTSGLFRSAGRGGPLWRGKACRPECSRRYGHVWMACSAAVFVALGLSATKWADSYRRRFRWGNSAFLRRLWLCFGHHAVFPRSFPLECISLLCGIWLSTGSLQEYPRQTGNLLHRLLTILWRCSSGILFLGGIPYAILHKLNFSACRMEYVLHRYEVNRKLQYIGVEVWLLHVYLTYFSEIQQSMLLKIHFRVMKLIKAQLIVWPR